MVLRLLELYFEISFLVLQSYQSSQFAHQIGFCPSVELATACVNLITTIYN